MIVAICIKEESERIVNALVRILSGDLSSEERFFHQEHTNRVGGAMQRQRTIAG